MSEVPKESQGPIERLTRIIGAVAVAGLVRHGAERQLDDARPDFLWPNARSEALRELAFKLGSAGREDDDAVKQLVDAAQRHRKDLLRAAAAIRSGGDTDEIARVNRANRLLLAAASGLPIQPVTAEEDARLRRIEALEQLPIEAAFARLSSLQPALSQFAEKLHEEVGRREMTEEGDERVENEILEYIMNGLPPLVGPNSEASDDLIRSKFAFDIARVHLVGVVGLLDQGD